MRASPCINTEGGKTSNISTRRCLRGFYEKCRAPRSAQAAPAEVMKNQLLKSESIFAVTLRCTRRAKVGKRPPPCGHCVYAYRRVVSEREREDVCLATQTRALSLAPFVVFVSAALLKNEKIPLVAFWDGLLWRCACVGRRYKKNRRFDSMRETRYFTHLCCQNTLFQSPRLTR